MRLWERYPRWSLAFVWALVLVLSLMLVRTRVWGQDASSKIPQTLEALQALGGQRFGWIILSLPDDVNVLNLSETFLQLWDGRGHPIAYADLAQTLIPRKDGGWNLHVFPLGNFDLSRPAKGEFRLATVSREPWTFTFTFRSAVPARLTYEGEGFSVREVLVNGPYVALFACFSPPDPRDWHPRLILEIPGSSDSWFLVYRHLFQAKRVLEQEERCHFYLFAPESLPNATETVKKQVVLRVEGLRLHPDQCLDDGEWQRIQGAARTQGQDAAELSFVYWTESPADWPYRWCPKPPERALQGEMQNGHRLGMWAQHRQALYDALFFHPLEVRVGISLP